ncbi:MAG: hypothetical protein L0154_15025 [Chloroflexi bacterium]|nr:hypothetical protein [Chloroflexota bacterium]
MKRLLLILVVLLLPLVSTYAQSGDGFVTYNNEDFGISFDIPADWTVEVSSERLIAGTPADIEASKNFQPPTGLIITITLGTYNSMGIQNANQLQGQMARFAPSGVTIDPAQTVTFGNSTGYSIDFELPDSPIYTRVALLTIPGARLAVVRGLAERGMWINDGSNLFIQIMQSAEFTLSADLANPLEIVPGDDGGVLWQYQTTQTETRPLELGGLTYDDFNIMYVAAGPSGILAINKNDGSFVNFLGPIADDDNLVDVALGPRDALLYFANASGDNNRIMVTDRVGNYVRGWGTPGEQPGQFAENMPQAIAVTRQNNVWAVSEGHSVDPRDRLYRFDSFGNLLNTIDLASINPELQGIRLDNNIYTEAIFLVGEQGGLNILDSDGSLLVPNVAKELITGAVPTDIAIGPQELIVISTENEGFLQFTNLGELVDRFGFPYQSERGGLFQPGEYLSPGGMVIDANGVLYFAETNPDTGSAQVQALEFTGSGVLPLPGRPSPEGGSTVAVTASGGEIVHGSTVRGMLDNNSPQHDYTFRASAGDRIVITMKDVSQGQMLDTMILLLDVNYNEVVNNDDVNNPPEGLKNTDSVLRFTPNSAGTFIIRATRFGGSGEYELTLDVEDSTTE